MNKNIFKLCTCLVFTLLFTNVGHNIAMGQMSESEFKKMLAKTLKENPQILFEVFEENSDELIKSITTASEKARITKLTEGWKNDVNKHKNFELKNRPMLGNANAKNVIIGFSDFLCGYCAQAGRTVESLISDRNDVKFVFKSVPNNPMSRLATKWFYQIYQKDQEKAWKFHDAIFANQKSLAENAENFLRAIAMGLGFDAQELATEIVKNNKKLEEIIENDLNEAKQYGFSGTPYFVVNNVVLKGAYPKDVLEKAIEFTNSKN